MENLSPFCTNNNNEELPLPISELRHSMAGHNGCSCCASRRVVVHHAKMHTDDILNINVGGKKFTLLADSRSKVGGLTELYFPTTPHLLLSDWFRPGTTRLIPADKGGNYFLDRDPKTFRHILAYLRLKKERCVTSLALPSKPDDLAKLAGECEALNLVELREMALEMMQKYLRTEEQHYVTSFVQMTMRDYDAWLFEKEQNASEGKKRGSGIANPQNNSAYDEWDSI